MIAAAIRTAPVALAEPDLIERVATHAAQTGDTALEQLCDEVHAGVTDESVVLGAIACNSALAEAVGMDPRWIARTAGGAR